MPYVERPTHLEALIPLHIRLSYGINSITPLRTVRPPIPSDVNTFLICVCKKKTLSAHGAEGISVEEAVCNSIRLSEFVKLHSIKVDRAGGKKPSDEEKRTAIDRWAVSHGHRVIYEKICRPKKAKEERDEDETTAAADTA